MLKASNFLVFGAATALALSSCGNSLDEQGCYTHADLTDEGHSYHSSQPFYGACERWGDYERDDNRTLDGKEHSVQHRLGMPDPSMFLLSFDGGDKHVLAPKYDEAFLQNQSGKIFRGNDPFTGCVTHQIEGIGPKQTLSFDEGQIQERVDVVLWGTANPDTVAHLRYENGLATGAYFMKEERYVTENGERVEKRIKVVEGQFEEGRPTGIWRWLEKETKLVRPSFSEGLLDGPTVVVDDNKYDHKKNVWVDYYDNGKLLRTFVYNWNRPIEESMATECPKRFPREPKDGELYLHEVRCYLTDESRKFDRPTVTAKWQAANRYRKTQDGWYFSYGKGVADDFESANDSKIAGWIPTNGYVTVEDAKNSAPDLAKQDNAFFQSVGL